eukprot:239420_1
MTFLIKQQTEQIIDFKENGEKKQLENEHQLYDYTSDSLDDIDDPDVPLLNKDKGFKISLNITSEKEKLYVDTRECVYFKRIEDKGFKSRLPPPIKHKPILPKYRRINGEIREEYSCSLEDELSDNKKPFLDIPLFSPDKNKRNIGNFKGLISIASKEYKLLTINIYEWKPYWSFQPDPHIIIEFDGTQTK